ncbi:hypothetical protein MHYP_G00206780 [Metynnis hypsauchen]
MLLSSVPKRLLLTRRSRSLSPCRALRTSPGEASRCCTRELEMTRSPTTATVTITPQVQYHQLANRWRVSLENRRSSWAALASVGRTNKYWEEEEGGGSRARGRAAATAGALSAAAVALCLKKDDDSKGEALLNAARSNNTQEVQRLLAAGLDPNSRHRLGWTALMVASMNRHHNQSLGLPSVPASTNAVWCPLLGSGCPRTLSGTCAFRSSPSWPGAIPFPQGIPRAGPGQAQQSLPHPDPICYPDILLLHPPGVLPQCLGQRLFLWRGVYNHTRIPSESGCPWQRESYHLGITLVIPSEWVHDMETVVELLGVPNLGTLSSSSVRLKHSTSEAWCGLAVGPCGITSAQLAF